MVEQVERRDRSNNFDFLRLFAAVAVLIHHSVIHLQVFFLWHGPLDTYWFNGGVPLFFILSGMMVYRSGEKCRAEGRRWWDFYRNRALRIMPAVYTYTVVVVVLFLAIGVVKLANVFSLQFLGFVASNFLLLPVYSPQLLSGFGVGVVNGSLPTIPMEVSFYLVVPLLVIVAVRFGWKKMLTAAFLVAAAGLILYAIVGGTESQPMIWRFFGVSFVPYLWFFALGILWSRLWPKVKQSGWIAAVAIVLYFVIDKLPADPGFEVLVRAMSAVPLSYAAMWFGYRGPKVFARFTRRFGDLSFGTYIMAHDSGQSADLRWCPDLADSWRFARFACAGRLPRHRDPFLALHRSSCASH